MRQRKQSQLKDDLNTDVSQVSNVEGAYVSPPFFLYINKINMNHKRTKISRKYLRLIF